jgi:hypothetical protein
VLGRRKSIALRPVGWARRYPFQFIVPVCCA